ncbi:MAG TPA: hypothetical protein VG345_00195, partial [Bryobacteraceae bacterium]|nr:hypothetical protein [Bryobacteraceae bacterium]
GQKFGDPGFYFVVHNGASAWARYVRSLKEAIHIYPGEDGGARADHRLTLWGFTFLRLHYRMRHRPHANAAEELRAGISAP